MKLDSIVIADPVSAVARRIAWSCTPMARRRVVATSVAALREAIATCNPEMVVVSLELAGDDTLSVIQEVRASRRDCLVVVTFRELSVPTCEQLRALGVTELLQQPVDEVALYRAASRHFGQPFRRHARHAMALDVRRADGVALGCTRDVSMGGMLLDALTPLENGSSLLVDLCSATRRIRVRARVLENTSDGVRLQFENFRGPAYDALLDLLENASSWDKAGPSIVSVVAAALVHGQLSFS
jgi:ActR/RegA family two-component response regulator